MRRTHLVRIAALIACWSAASAQATPSIKTLPLGAVPLKAGVAQLTQPQSALKIDLPGRSLTFATKTLSPEAGMTGVRGATADAQNRLQAFVWNDRILSADVYADDGRYTLVNNLGRDFWVRDADLGPRSLADDTNDVPQSAVSLQLATTPAPIASPQSDGTYRIDLLVVYTPAYQQVTQVTQASITAEAQRLIFLANTYFKNSLMPITYRLVGVSQFSATGEQEDCHANVAAMTADPGLRTLRNSTGADVVALLRTDAGNDSTGGLGSGFNGTTQSNPPTNVDAERDAFACIHAAPATAGGDARSLDLDHVFAHELAHVLGAGHQYMGPKAVYGGYWRPYAHAWRCGRATEGGPANGPGVYYSIMYGNVRAGGNELGFGPNCLVNLDGIELCPTRHQTVTVPQVQPIGSPKGDFFSDPATVRGNLACGIMVVQPPLGEALQADNRRSIMEAAPYVAAYRATVIP